MLRVDQLAYYPVKGCAGTPVRAAEVTATGLALDRAFMVVDEHGMCRTQRRFPMLATVRPIPADGGLTLTAPGVEDLHLEVAIEGPRSAVAVFTWEGKGIDQGTAAADWLSTVLGSPSRLIRVPPDHQRATDGIIPGTAGFADSSAILVTTTSSLDGLNERIAEQGGEPVPMNRFRPNIVLSGWTEPHTEDGVRRLAVGEVELGYTKMCVRCPVPTVDQDTGTRAGPEPIRTLARYRRAPEGGVTFGIKMAVLRTGRVNVGDEAVVPEWAPPWA
ncbi:MOSC domain-containing protein [Amycolatopsis aidingensis]|uniref:MOSC domain-containing protein n=1 Tax=Amycolatopsis aidingensis TaxID=2842453 RepID=UPI001C0AA8D1|nr:MOSC N-terminal beta barrel domain-containing protein [Amycolatopsis aidingensis]